MAKRKSKRWTDSDVKGKGGATQAPMCKLCHTRHWNRDPHKYGDKPPRKGKITLDNIKVKT